MTLRISEIPCSFTGQALYYAATSRLMGQDIVDPFGIVQSLAWVIYDIAVNLFCAPAGVVYHSGAAIFHKARSFSTSLPDAQKKQAALAWEHFKAASTDVMGLGLFFLIYLRIRAKESYPNFLWLWFSSTNVQIEHPLAESPGLGSDKIDRVVPMYWGSQDMPNSRQCSFVNLLLSAYSQGINLENQDVLRSAFTDDWEHIQSSSKFFSHFWLERPKIDVSFQAPSSIEKPAYTIHWKTIAWAVAGIAAFAFAALTASTIFFIIDPSMYVFGIVGAAWATAKIIFVMTATFSGSAYCFGRSLKGHLTNKGTAQMTLADRLMEEIVTEGNSSQGRQKVKSALGWYQKAALNGYTPALRRFGLCLLASLPHKNAVTMDNTELLLVKEAIQSLQAAAINQDVEARQDLRLLFNIGSNMPNIGNRIYQGVAGDTESDRIRNLFPPGHNFIDIAVSRYDLTEPNETKRNRIRWILIEPRRAPRIKALYEVIASEESLGKNPFPRDLANLIEDYEIGPLGLAK